MAGEKTSGDRRTRIPNTHLPNTRLPNWKTWLTEIAESVAQSSDDYQLALAARMAADDRVLVETGPSQCHHEAGKERLGAALVRSRHGLQHADHQSSS